MGQMCGHYGIYLIIAHLLCVFLVKVPWNAAQAWLRFEGATFQVSVYIKNILISVQYWKQYVNLEGERAT